MSLWPFKRKRKPPQVVFRATGLDIRAEDWRRNSMLLTTAHRVTNDLGFVQMLECLRTENPGNFTFAALDAPLHARAVHQAEIEGWNRCIETMLSLAKPILEENETPEEDYGVEPEPKK